MPGSRTWTKDNPRRVACPLCAVTVYRKNDGRIGKHGYRKTVNNTKVEGTQCPASGKTIEECLGKKETE